MNTDKQYPLPAEQAETEKAHAKEPKKAKRNRRRSTAAEVMETVSSWATGAVLIGIAAACLFGPAFVSEMREDKIMSVLDLSDEQLRNTPMSDLTDIRKYVDEYETDDDVNKRAAEKAGKILDEAIEDRIDR